jgi:hypothetical protein
MKHSHILLLSITLLSTTHYTHSSADQDFDANLNTIQQSISILISQSDLDPEVAQDITDKISQLNQQAQANIQEDAKDIRVAAGLTSILESSNALIQATNISNIQPLLNQFKYAARINTLHKLITGALSGKLSNLPYYTDPYTETAGFTVNNCLINGILTALLTGVQAKIPGTSLVLDITTPAQAWLLQAAAGVIAHYAWLLQKKYYMSQQQKKHNKLK